jgi:hypothetical protein
MRSHFAFGNFFRAANTSPFRKVAVQSAVCFGDAIAISIQPESHPSIAGYAHRLLEQTSYALRGALTEPRQVSGLEALRRPTASSTRRDAPARRRWSAAQGRIRGRIGASRLAGRFCGLAWLGRWGRDSGPCISSRWGLWTFEVALPPPVGRPSPRPSPREERGEGEEAQPRGDFFIDAAGRSRCCVPARDRDILF